MSDHAKFRLFLLAPIVLALFVVVNSPVSWAGELEDAQAEVRLNPNNAKLHINLGLSYRESGQYQEAIASFKEAIRIKPDFAVPHYVLGYTYGSLLGQYQEAIAEYKEALRLDPDYTLARNNLNALKGVLRITPDLTIARNNLNKLKQKTADERLALEQRLLEEERKKHKARQNIKEADRLARERLLLEEERRKWEDRRLAEENRQQPPEEQTPQSGSGSGFFVSKMGHVITNAHVVKGCNRVTVGDNANKQVSADIINTDRSNDLALLKLSTLEMTSAESKSLIQKLSIAVIPLASKGLLRSEDVRLGEKVLVAGFPFGDFFSNSIKVTTGVVSSTRGPGDDSGQFQLDAAIQPGNSGGPIYDSSGNIVGVVISQLDKRKVEKAIGSLPENVNFGIKASTVRQFLTSSGLPSKKSERTEEKSTEQLAEIAQNQALMVMCLH